MSHLSGSKDIERSISCGAGFAPLLYTDFCLGPLGRMDEAAAQIDQAIQDDPLNLILLTTRAMVLVSTNRNEEAEAALQQVLELDEGFWLAHNFYPNRCVSTSAWRHGTSQ